MRCQPQLVRIDDLRLVGPLPTPSSHSGIFLTNFIELRLANGHVSCTGSACFYCPSRLAVATEVLVLTSILPQRAFKTSSFINRTGRTFASISKTILRTAGAWDMVSALSRAPESSESAPTRSRETFLHSLRTRVPRRSSFLPHGYLQERYALRLCCCPSPQSLTLPLRRVAPVLTSP